MTFAINYEYLESIHRFLNKALVNVIIDTIPCLPSGLPPVKQGWISEIEGGEGVMTVVNKVEFFIANISFWVTELLMSAFPWTIVSNS